MYRTEIAVQESNVEQAWQTACTYDQSRARLTEPMGRLAWFKANRRMNKVEKELCSLTRQQYSGDVAGAERDIASGLLEPYSAADKHDRAILAGIIAGRVLSADVVVTEDAILW